MKPTHFNGVGTSNLSIMNEKIDQEDFHRLKRELVFQNVEIETLKAELIKFKNENVNDYKMKQERAAELIIANKELTFQKNEKQKRANELITANNNLDFQRDEKQNRADELIIANDELNFQKDEKQKRAEELIILNNELAVQYEAKRELASELTGAYTELIKTEESLRNYIEGLEDMIHMISHNVRQPITQILGITNLLDESIDYSTYELKKIVGYLKPSALDLDNFTKEFTVFMQNISSKEGKTGQDTVSHEKKKR